AAGAAFGLGGATLLRRLAARGLVVRLGSAGGAGAGVFLLFQALVGLAARLLLVVRLGVAAGLWRLVTLGLARLVLRTLGHALVGRRLRIAFLLAFARLLAGFAVALVLGLAGLRGGLWLGAGVLRLAGALAWLLVLWLLGTGVLVRVVVLLAAVGLV